MFIIFITGIKVPKTLPIRLVHHMPGYFHWLGNTGFGSSTLSDKILDIFWLRSFGLVLPLCVESLEEWNISWLVDSRITSLGILGTLDMSLSYSFKSHSQESLSILIPAKVRQQGKDNFTTWVCKVKMIAGLPSHLAKLLNKNWV